MPSPACRRSPTSRSRRAAPTSSSPYNLKVDGVNATDFNSINRCDTGSTGRRTRDLSDTARQTPVATDRRHRRQLHDHDHQRRDGVPRQFALRVPDASAPPTPACARTWSPTIRPPRSRSWSVTSRARTATAASARACTIRLPDGRAASARCAMTRPTSRHRTRTPSSTSSCTASTTRELHAQPASGTSTPTARLVRGQLPDLHDELQRLLTTRRPPWRRPTRCR